MNDPILTIHDFVRVHGAGGLEHTLQHIGTFFGAERYTEHSVCLTNDPIIMMLYVAGDLTTWLAYFVIGFTLMSRRHILADLSPTALGMYGAFIFICGLSHFMDTVVLFTGVYRLDVAVTMAMAAISAVTAVYTVISVWGPTNEST